MIIKHNFFGKECQIDRELKNRQNLENCLKEKGINSQNTLLLNQVHGADIVIIDSKEKIYGDQGLPKVDGIVTNLKNIAIGVITADCAPILFFDEENEIIAAAHAGWKGAKFGIIKSIIKGMQSLGAKNISAMVGPMIAQDSYEVSQDFYEDFLVDDRKNKQFFKPGAKDDKFLFNLPNYVEEMLKNAGIKNIQSQNIDTYQNERTLFSYRRSTHKGEENCGRNVSIIALQD